MNIYYKLGLDGIQTWILMGTIWHRLPTPMATRRIISYDWVVKTREEITLLGQFFLPSIPISI